ncbi:hypothetical protein [Chitinophaga arvensicola]|nr:hypothetical protein [Chitinophaga arvensicola]
MKTNCSCGAATGSSDRKTTAAQTTGPLTIRQRFVKGVRWLIPGITLVLLPKCPVCFAAYVALGTGIGLSVTAAAWLRTGLVVLCVGSLIYLVLSRILAYRKRRSALP